MDSIQVAYSLGGATLSLAQLGMKISVRADGVDNTDNCIVKNDNCVLIISYS